MKNLLTILLLWLTACSAGPSGNTYPVRLNSVGFLPAKAKMATIIQRCTNFEVKRLADDSTVFRGKVTGPFHQKDVNQNAWLADFSAFADTGSFYLDVPGVGRSVTFRISDDVFRLPYVTTMRAFYLWRCGTAVEGDFNGQHYAHAACHLDDGYSDYLDKKDVVRDGTGGWHDAGDYGKYTVNAGITLGNLFLAWEQFSPAFENVKLDLPQTAPGYPGYLEELKWETDWLLKMPYPDGSGRVSHKLTRTNFAGFIMPDDDKGKRYFTEWSSAATAGFAAVMAMAARNFQPYDSAYAEKCLTAAKNSYAFLKEHPEMKPFEQGDFKTGAYKVASDKSERLWAAAELWETTGAPAYLADFESAVPAIHPPLIDSDWDWGNVKNLAMFTYVLSQREGRNPQLLTSIRQAILANADSLVEKGKQDIYGRPLGSRYYWGCNGTVARQAVNLQVANAISPKPAYTNTVVAIVDHLLGRNVYDRSYITGIGFRPPMHPHDRRSAADDVVPPWPGYLVGGGRTATGWQDKQSDYTTNEIAINWQAALVYALAGLVD
ncbi:glycoside hydrolase family 9 protein [Prolixibacter sp. SD074]|uniref:glycoside hydrolase family 9 protein n=1 Tax=Prolixibacter sp. SD074 TaxID=2652391 RepID=UPI0012991791|nr:glycoside hydrolase family 9 protein [Prolixibacter sp. SD074]